MNFFINKNSTLPLLIMELIQNSKGEYNHFFEKIQNANITFSMIDVNTGVKRISKAPATCEIKLNNPDSEEEYYFIYSWKEKDTCKAGTYKGEFSFEFLDGSGTLIAPVREELIILVNEGSIKN